VLWQIVLRKRVSGKWYCLKPEALNPSGRSTLAPTSRILDRLRTLQSTGTSSRNHRRTHVWEGLKENAYGQEVCLIFTKLILLEKRSLIWSRNVLSCMKSESSLLCSCPHVFLKTNLALFLPLRRSRALSTTFRFSNRMSLDMAFKNS
jgi:hypothetical protein